MERSRNLIMLTLASCGVLMVILSFLPWVTFSSIDYGGLDGDYLPGTSISVTGTEISRLRDTETIGTNTIQEVDEWCSCRVSLGDGYLVAALGSVVVAASALAFFSGRSGAAGSMATVASGSALIMAGYNAMADWQAFAWTRERQTEVLDGAVTPFLWALVALSAAATVLGGALWSMARFEGSGELLDDEYDDTDYEIPERLNAWA
jgi:hypothetical protein